MSAKSSGKARKGVKAKGSAGKFLRSSDRPRPSCFRQGSRAGFRAEKKASDRGRKEQDAEL